MTTTNPPTQEFKCISCRVPVEVYDDFRGLLHTLEKNTNYFVSNAITEYVRLIKSGDMPNHPSKGLQLDRFAYELENPTEAPPVRNKKKT